MEYKNNENYTVIDTVTTNRYKKEENYTVVSVAPLILRTKAADDGLEISMIKHGATIYCKSFTRDDHNDIWIRNNSGWLRATRGKIVYVM